MEIVKSRIIHEICELCEINNNNNKTLNKNKVLAPHWEPADFTA